MNVLPVTGLPCRSRPGGPGPSDPARARPTGARWRAAGHRSAGRGRRAGSPARPDSSIASGGTEHLFSQARGRASASSYASQGGRAHLVGRAVGHQDPGRVGRQALADVALGGHPTRRIGGGHASTGQAGRLGRRIAGHQPDLVAGRGKAALDQLDGLDDHGRRTIGLGGRDRSLDRPAHVRVGQALQPGQGRRVIEDRRGECPPVKAAVRPRHGRPEGRPRSLPARPARR